MLQYWSYVPWEKGICEIVRDLTGSNGQPAHQFAVIPTSVSRKNDSNQKTEVSLLYAQYLAEAK
jgi:hypothetical protein